MHLCFHRHGAAALALLLCVIPLRADLTLPTTAAPLPPQADAQLARVWRGDRATVPLRGHHSGSGTVTFWIVERPRHGALSNLRLLGDNRATIVYQHDARDPAASDRFTYLVKTSGDQISSPAEVRVVIQERPPRLQVPGRIEFDEVMAGESETRQLTITNEGGGLLEGRLTVSAPWRLAAPEYRVASGETQAIGLVFSPNDARAFVGQITLASPDGSQTHVMLEGRASSPLALEPAKLRIGLPKEKNGPRAASLSLTNRSERLLQLKFSPGSSIEPIADVTLAPSERKEISVVMSPHSTAALHETVIVRGDGFSARLPVDADPLPPQQNQASPLPIAATPAASTPPSATPAPPELAQLSSVRPEETASLPLASPNVSLVPVRAQRIATARWELRWARPKEPVATYRIEERLVSLEGTGQLQIAWRSLASSEVVAAGDAVTAQLKGLDPHQLHLLKVTALGPDSATLWESPLVALSPPREQPHHGRGWAIILGITLVVLIGLRWRANRSSA